MKEKVVNALVLLGVVIAFLIVFSLLVMDYRELVQSGVFGSAQYPVHSWRTFYRTHAKQPPTVNDVAFIRSWMTFGYINRIFNLPTDYLKNQLTITDSQYPNLTIQKCATEQRQSDSSIVQKIQDSVRQYLVSHNSQ